MIQIPVSSDLKPSESVLNLLACTMTVYNRDGARVKSIFMSEEFTGETKKNPC